MSLCQNTLIRSRSFPFHCPPSQATQMQIAKKPIGIKQANPDALQLLGGSSQHKLCRSGSIILGYDQKTQEHLKPRILQNYTTELLHNLHSYSKQTYNDCTIGFIHLPGVVGGFTFCMLLKPPTIQQVVMKRDIFSTGECRSSSSRSDILGDS